MKNKVYNYIELNKMLDCANLIVGLSGGADSICLISILQDYIRDNKLDINLYAVHVNHGIRKAAIADEEFVVDFCKKRNINLKVVRIDCIGLAKKNNQTVEEAGRLERYRIFRELAKDKDNARIAVAHHMNDQAETVLMNMARGTNLSGMRGIKPVRDKIIRPLLCVTRMEIENYIEENGLKFVTDETNFNNEYTRNSIRNIVIPTLTDNVNVRAVNNIAMLAENLSQIEDYLNIETTKAIRDVLLHKDNVSLDVKKLDKYHAVIQSRVIYEAIVGMAKKKKDIYEVHVKKVQELINKDTNKQISLPYGLYAKKEYGKIIIDFVDADKKRTEKNRPTITVNKSDIKNELIINLDEDIYYKDEIRRLKAIKCSIVDNNFSIKDKDSDFLKCFDYDKIKECLDIRYRQTNDVIVIDGLGHSHRIKSEFINRKIPNRYRDECILICQGDECLWAVGVRRSYDALVDNNTKKILMIQLMFD